MIQEILLATLVLIASAPNSSALQETVQTAFFPPLHSDLPLTPFLEASPPPTIENVQDLKEKTYAHLLDTRENFISHVDRMSMEQANAVEAELTRAEELIVAADVSLKQEDAISAHRLLFEANQYIQKAQIALTAA